MEKASRAMIWGSGGYSRRGWADGRVLGQAAKYPLRRVRQSPQPVRHDRVVAWSKKQLGERIDEVLVDAYGDGEQLGSFACVLDELLETPVSASVLGEPVVLVSVADEGDRLGLRARCRRDGRRWDVALYDVTLGADAGPDLDLTIEAYRLWARGLR